MVRSADGRLYVIIKPPQPTFTVLQQLFQSLAEAAGGVPVVTPHLTVQTVYDLSLVSVVWDRLRDIARGTAPLQVRASGISTFPERTVANSLHIPVEKHDALVLLRQNIALALKSRGISTQPFDQDTWRPHITAVQGQWDDPYTLAEQLNHRVPTIEFVGDSLVLSVQEEPGFWRDLEELPLRGPKLSAPTAPLPEEQAPRDILVEQSCEQPTDR